MLYGCDTPRPRIVSVPTDWTLVFKVGSSLQKGAGIDFFDVENSGKTVFYSGDTLVWLAIIGNGYFGETLQVELVYLDTGKTIPLHSEFLEDKKIRHITGELIKPEQRMISDLLTLQNLTETKKVMLRLKVDNTIIEKRLLFSQ